MCCQPSPGAGPAPRSPTKRPRAVAAPHFRKARQRPPTAFAARRGSRAHRRRLGARRRQVRAGRLDRPMGDVDRHGCPRHRHRQHRGPAADQDLAGVAKWHRLSSRHWFTSRRRRCIRAAPPRQDLARRRHHLVGEQHRSLRRPAQQGPARLRPVRRGGAIADERVGDDRGRADRRRHRDRVDSSATRPATPAASANASRPLRPSLGPAADRSRTVGDDQQGADRQWIKDYGEDSDFVRVRVRGVFPRAGSLQFIDGERVAEAVARPLPSDPMRRWSWASTWPASATTRA